MIFTDMPMLSRPDKTGFNDSLSFGPFLEMGNRGEYIPVVGSLALYCRGNGLFVFLGLISARARPHRGEHPRQR